MANNTELGKYLKKLRIDRGENMNAMATKLAVSTSFLSSVESGKKKIPGDMATKIYNLYDLSGKNKNEYIKALSLSSEKIEIPLNMDDERNEIAALFAATLPELDEKKLKEIKKILEV